MDVGYKYIVAINKLCNIPRNERNNMASVKVDLKAPDFELKEFNGETFKLSDYKGKSNVLIVLNRGFV